MSKEYGHHFYMHVHIYMLGLILVGYSQARGEVCAGCTAHKGP